MPPAPKQIPFADDDRREEAAFYERHWRTVARWVARLGGPLTDVEDLTHEVFLEAFAALPSFRGEAKVSTWLFRITARTVTTHRHRGRWRRWLSGLPRDYAASTASSEPSALDELEQRDAARVLYRALDRLDDNLRTTFILAELEEMSTEQIAEMQRIAPSTVWVRLHRARKALSKMSLELGTHGPKGEEL